MKLLNEMQMSEWALRECMNGNNIPEIRKLINNDYDALIYCDEVKDIKEMWSKIKGSHVANLYCKFVKDRPEVRKLWSNCEKNKKSAKR